jgi:serine/threonine-protein kinase RsbW
MNAPMPRAQTGEIVELRIPAKAEWVAVARLAVAAVANRLNLSVEDIEDVRLAISEACTICIRQGVPGDQIEITCEAEEDELRLTARGRAATPRLVGETHPEDTLGLVIIESLMDAVEYVAEGSGTLVVMTKHVPKE